MPEEESEEPSSAVSAAASDGQVFFALENQPRGQHYPPAARAWVLEVRRANPRLTAIEVSRLAAAKSNIAASTIRKWLTEAAAAERRESYNSPPPAPPPSTSPPPNATNPPAFPPATPADNLLSTLLGAITGQGAASNFRLTAEVGRYRLTVEEMDGRNS